MEEGDSPSGKWVMASQSTLTSGRGDSCLPGSLWAQCQPSGDQAWSVLFLLYTWLRSLRQRGCVSETPEVGIKSDWFKNFPSQRQRDQTAHQVRLACEFRGPR